MNMSANWTEAAESGDGGGGGGLVEEVGGNWLVNALQIYYTPALVIVGSAGNILSLAVIRSSSQLRRLSASVYLCALAISDTAFLGTLLVFWLSFISEERETEPQKDSESLAASLFSGALCPLFVYTTFVSTFLSAWLVLAFTAERFVAVRYPLKRASLCTTRRARMVLLALTVLSLAAFSPMLFIARAQTVTKQSSAPGNHQLSEGKVGSSVPPPPEGDHGAVEAGPSSDRLHLLEDPDREGAPWSTTQSEYADYEEPDNSTASDGDLLGSFTWTTHASSEGGPFLDSSEDGVYEATTVHCALDKRYAWIAEVLNGVDTVFAFLVPCLGIAALNAAIVASMWEVGKERGAGRKRHRRPEGGRSFSGWRSAVHRSSPPGSKLERPSVALDRPESFRALSPPPSPVDLACSPLFPHSSSHKTPEQQAPRRPQPIAHRRRPHAKITGMLLVVSTVFVALNMPSYVIRALTYVEASRVRNLGGDQKAQDAAAYYLIVPQYVAHILFNTNFGINFALYCVFGRNFRRALRSLFCRRRMVCRCCCVKKDGSYSGECGRVMLVRGGRRRGESGTPERGTSTVVSEYSRSCRRSTVLNGNSSWDGAAVEMESIGQ